MTVIYLLYAPLPGALLCPLLSLPLCPHGLSCAGVAGREG
jgi:hypothetical protein